MSYQNDDYSGIGGTYHPLESTGGFGTLEKTFFMTLVFLPIVFFQFLTVLMTVLGVMLAFDHKISSELYGPLSNPFIMLLTGIVAWILLRLLRLHIIRMCGGGLIPRSELYRPTYRGHDEW